MALKDFTVNGVKYTLDYETGLSNKPKIPTTVSELIDSNNYVKLENGKISNQYIELPSYVDDVIEYPDFSNFPATGESGKIYIDTSNNFTYRWSGTTYIQIGGADTAELEIEITNIKSKNDEQDIRLSDLQKNQFSGNYDDLINKPSIPSLAGYATQSWVTGTALSGYALKTQLTDEVNELNERINAITGNVEGLPTLDNVYTKAETNAKITEAVTELVNDAPEALNTLKELSTALGDDANFASTVTTSIASKADKKYGVYYVAGNTTGTAGTWTGTNSDITEYYDGLVVNYKVGIAGGASTTTLNINDLGAKTCYLIGTGKLTNQYAVGTMVLLSYNATKDAFYSADDIDTELLQLHKSNWVSNDYIILVGNVSPNNFESSIRSVKAICSEDLTKIPTINPNTGDAKFPGAISEGGTLLSNKYLSKSGGEINGTLTFTAGDLIARYVAVKEAGHETGTYEKIATLSSKGYIRYRKPEEILSDIGAISEINKQMVIDALGYTPPTQDTKYGGATTSAAGLMSAADKTKLDGIQTSADAVSFTSKLTSGTEIGTITINGTETTIYCEKASDNVASKSQGVYYVAGNTTGTAGTWTGTNSDIESYYDGLVVNYKVGIAGADTTTLNINNLGAKICYLRGTSKITTQYAVGTMVLLSYNATTGAFYSADYDSNTNTQLRVYRQTSEYNADYPILVSRTKTASIATVGEDGSYESVYAVIGNDGVKTPTINPHTGDLKILGAIYEGGFSLSDKYVSISGDSSIYGNLSATNFYPKDAGTSCLGSTTNKFNSLYANYLYGSDNVEKEIKELVVKNYLESYMKLTDAQTVKGAKTFSDAIVIGSAGGLTVSGIMKIDGKLQARSSSSVSTYGSGTAGQVLMSGGSSKSPYWGTVSSGGSTIYAHRINIEDSNALGYAEFILYSSSSASINTFDKLYNALVAQGGPQIGAIFYSEESYNGESEVWHPCSVACGTSSAAAVISDGSIVNLVYISDVVKSI